MCEQGLLQVDKVKFDQVNSVGIRGGEHVEKPTQYEWEECYLVEETLRGVGPMERGFHLFKRRARQPLFLMLCIIDLIDYSYIVHSLLFSKSCRGNSCLGFLLLLERPLEELH